MVSSRPAPPATKEDTAAAQPAALPPGTRLVAESLVRSIPVFDAVGAPQPRTSLSNPNEDGAPRVFLVVADQGDWLQVLLPVRPNGSTGWIRRGDVAVKTTTYRVKVELNAHRITVWNGDQVVDQEPVGVGRANAPTPGGQYYITELLQPPNPAGAYGPYAFGLSGFSDVYKSFNGGNGVIGLHGTNEPGGLGRDVSHGCIRISNEGITKLAKMLPLGTPVEIVS